MLRPVMGCVLEKEENYRSFMLRPVMGCKFRACVKRHMDNLDISIYGNRHRLERMVHL